MSLAPQYSGIIGKPALTGDDDAPRYVENPGDISQTGRQPGRQRARHGVTSGGKSNGTPEYAVWKMMRQRCLNPRAKKFSDYGARGIRVCDRWASFENFIADMGPRPGRGFSLERENNDGDYEPTNCKWATPTEQANNRRKRRAYRLPKGEPSHAR